MGDQPQPLELTDCPPPPELNNEQKASKAAEIAKAMGVRACETSQESFTANFGSSAFGLLSAEMEVTTNKTSTIGCESLMINASEYNQSQQNITCIINKSGQKSTINTKAGNSIEFEAGKDIEINCPNVAGATTGGFSLKQNIDLDSVTEFKFNQETITAIENQTKDSIKKTTDLIQKSETGLGATPAGQKAASEELTNIQNTDYGKLVNESIQEIGITTDTQNNIKLKAGGNIIIKGNNCTIDQGILLRVIANNIMSNSYSSAFKNIAEKINESDTRMSQENKAKGAESLKSFGAYSPAALIGALGNLLIPLAIIGALGGAIFLFFKMKGSEKKEEKYDTI
jgi:hypothetical protein